MSYVTAASATAAASAAQPIREDRVGHPIVPVHQFVRDIYLKVLQQNQNRPPSSYVVTKMIVLRCGHGHVTVPIHFVTNSIPEAVHLHAENSSRVVSLGSITVRLAGLRR